MKIKWQDGGDWNVTSIYVHTLSSVVTVICEKGMKVEQINISMETADAIGLINLDKLEAYLKERK